MHHQNGDAQLPIADGLLVTLLAVLLQFIGTIMMPESLRLERQEMKSLARIAHVATLLSLIDLSAL